MKGILILYSFVLVMWMSACHSSTPQNHEEYTCPMHPQILKTAAGACPICKMPLVLKINKVKDEQKSSENTAMNTGILSALPTDTLQTASFTSHIEVLGQVALNPKYNGTIVSNAEGRIEKLYVKSNYEKVYKGQKIMELYSPELLTAQEDLLYLLNHDATNTALIAASQQKLWSLGMSRLQIQQLISRKKVFQTVTVYSLFSGYVKSVEGGNESVNAMNSDANSGYSLLNISEGMYVKRGQSVLNVYTQGKAWALLDVYNQDLAWVKKGLDVEIMAEVLPEHTIHSQLIYVEPWYANGSKTLKARAEIDNSKWHLPIGSALKANIYFKTAQLQWLPKSAVVTLGYAHVVFVKNKVGFSPRKVKLSIDYKDMIAVVSGLEKGEQVARVGQYLVDNEQFVSDK